MSDDQQREIAELEARLAQLKAPTVPPILGAARKAAQKSDNRILIGVIIAVVGAVAILSFMDAQPKSRYDPASLSASEPSWSPPDGYDLHTTSRGGSVGVEWVEPTSAECRSGVSCWAVNVITEKDCPRSLYASITLFNASGDNVGWTNDTAQGVQAGERTKLVFTTYERNVKSARIAELNCY